MDRHGWLITPWLSTAGNFCNPFPSPTMPALVLSPLTPQAYSVHTPDGAHVGNLKQVGTVWKFKAVGYDADGQMVPGGGQVTARHNTPLAAPDAAELSRRLGMG